MKDTKYFITYQRNIRSQYRDNFGEGEEWVGSINNIVIDQHPIEWLIDTPDEVVILFWKEIEITEQQRKDFDKETFVLLL